MSVALVSGVAARAEAENDPWAAYRFLIGEWTGEGSGQPGQGRGGFSFVPELGGKVLVRRNRNEIATAPDRPPAVHEDLLVVYPAERGGRTGPSTSTTKATSSITRSSPPMISRH